MSKKRTSKKNVYKLLTWSEDCKLEIVEMEMNLKMDFIARFGTESIPTKTELENWINSRNQ